MSLFALSNLQLESSIWIDSAEKIYFVRSDKVRKYDLTTRSSMVVSLPISSLIDEAQGIYSLWGDSVGKLYLSDTYNHFIRTLNLSDSTAPLVTVAGNGDDTIPKNGAIATSTGIGLPFQIWVNLVDHFFFTDNKACNVYEVNEEGRIYKILGTGSYGVPRIGSSIVTQIGTPVGIVGDSVGSIYVATNSGIGVIYKLSDPVNYEYKIECFAGATNSYSLQGSYGNGDGLLASSIHFTYITSIGIDSYSNLYVEDGGSKVIRKIDGVNRMTRVIVDKTVYNQVDCDYDDQIDDVPRAGNHIFVTNGGALCVYRCSSIRFIAPNQLTTQPLPSIPLISTNTIHVFALVGILFVLFTTYKKVMKIFSSSQ
eukprot:gene12761-13985_t